MKKVMIVDDERDVADLFEGMLCNQKKEVQLKVAAYNALRLGYNTL